MNQENKVVNVVARIEGPVQTNTENPWRTRAEYIEEQKQHQWQFRLTIAALLVSIVVSLAAVVSAYGAIAALKTSQVACSK